MAVYQATSLLTMLNGSKRSSQGCDTALPYVHPALLKRVDGCHRLRAALPLELKNEVLPWQFWASSKSYPVGAELLGFDPIEVTCLVCFEDLIFSKSLPRQCVNGHLICQACLDKLPRSPPFGKVAFPACRAIADRAAFGFNRWLESCLQRRSVLCRDDCGAVLVGKQNLSDHFQECPNRLVKCEMCPATRPQGTFKDFLEHLWMHKNIGNTWKLPSDEVTCGGSWILAHPLLALERGGLRIRPRLERAQGVLHVEMSVLELLGTTELSVTFCVSVWAESRLFEASVRVHLVPGHAPITRAFHLGITNPGRFIIDLTATFREKRPAPV